MAILLVEIKCAPPLHSNANVSKFVLFGAWRSLEAHLNGVQGVAGSNPVAPTSEGD